MNGSNSIVTIGSLEVFQDNITAYGKTAETDKLTLSTNALKTTITPSTTDTLAKSGDLMYVYPFLASSVAVTDSDGNLVINLEYLKNGIGFVEKTITITLTGVAAAGTIVGQINAQLVADGVDNIISAVVVDSDKVRIQALAKNVMFNIDAGASATGLKIPTGTPAYIFILGIKDDIEKKATATPVEIEVFKRYAGKSEALSIGEYTDLQYEVVRNVGEMTGATLNSTLDPVIYKGLSKVAKQIEYAEGSASLACDEMAFNVENLEYVYGWTKEVDGTFMSGKTTVEDVSKVIKYSFNEYTNPEQVGLFGLHKKIDGGLIMFSAESSKTNNLDLSMKKTEFRTSGVEFMLLTPSSKCVWSLVSI